MYDRRKRRVETGIILKYLTKLSLNLIKVVSHIFTRNIGWVSQETDTCISILSLRGYGLLGSGKDL